MAKYTPLSTSSGYNLQNINQNFVDIANFINNNLLCRKNPVGEPNQMFNDLDLNGHDLLNVKKLDAQEFTVAGHDPLEGLQAFVDEAEGFAEQSQTYANNAAASASAASTSATAAGNSASSAASSLTQVQALFLGAFASDPATASEGALYYNSTVLELRYRRNGVWVPFPQANTVARQFFVAGTDFTAGTTTVLTLPSTSYTKNVLWVYFDGNYVQPNRYTLTDQTHLTFTAAITAGTTRIEVGYITPLASTIVDDNSLTTAKYQDLSVTTAKIADNSIVASKLPDDVIVASKIVSASPALDVLKQKLDIVGRVANIAALRTADISHYAYFIVGGYYFDGDQGGGLFRITSDTTSTDNGGTIITHTASGQRFYRLNRGAPSVYDFGVKADGVTNDAAAINAMSIAGYDITVPYNKTIVLASNTTINTRLTFGGGSRLSSTSGVVNLLQKPNADPQQLIFIQAGGTFAFSGSTPWDECSADWFNVNAEVGQAINIAWKFSYTVTLNKRTYAWNSSAIPPAQIQGLVLKGKGYRATQVTVANSIVAINYQRVAGQQASSIHISDIAFTENGLSQTSTAFRWYGAAVGAPGSESAIYDDNWCKVERCVFLGLLRANDTGYATQCYWTDNYYQSCAVCHFMTRDSSFFYFRGEMGLDNTFTSGSYIYQQDPVNDARSNGLTVTDCHNVLSFGIDVQLQNYQLAQFINTTLDLGQGGAAALYLNNCQDIHFHDGWIACHPTARTAGRVGIFSQTTRHSSFNGNTFNSCYIGYQGNNASSTSINDNAFDNSLNADITDISAGVGMVVMGNKHKNNVTGVPIGFSAGHANVVAYNIMAGSSYSINAGTNSINTPNIFSAAFPV